MGSIHGTHFRSQIPPVTPRVGPYTDTGIESRVYAGGISVGLSVREDGGGELVGFS